MEAYLQQQLESLTLEKEMKLNDIVELEEHIVGAISNLKKNVKSLNDMKTELEQGAK